jgi:3-deoxy-D-manno-octulosonic-acid transferase
MHALYNLGIRCYGLILNLAALFVPKARLWVNGRKGWRGRYQELSNYQDGYWFHCASLGEFEQGRPVMEALRNMHPERPLIVTFFSPSGYEIRKNYEGADWVGYLPLDTPKNARDFVQLARPSQVFFVKYEFWANYLVELKRQRIPAYCVSGLFRPTHRFFKPYGGFFRSVLTCFDHFFVQTSTSQLLLNQIGFTNVTLSGDTRYDRVLQNASQVVDNSVIRSFAGDSKVFVVGSSWSEDEEVIFPFIESGEIATKIIIAPHEIGEKHIQNITAKLSVPYARFTECDSSTQLDEVRVLILDCIGQLANAYRFGAVAYVGGAFGKGLHNILEPAVFGLPVIFGPRHEKFPEAAEFIAAGIGFSISTKQEFQLALNSITANQVELSDKAKAFIQSKSGATEIILRTLNEKSTR